jgi:hypothetical protein
MPRFMEIGLADIPAAGPALAAPEAPPPVGAPIAQRPRRKAKVKPRCEDCFFFQNQLCALEDRTPCPTFRPAHPDGLRPPRQLSFAFRTDRRPELFVPPFEG